MSIASGTRLGRYEIRSLLGAGGMGEVYLAQDTMLERTVALKVLPPDVATDENPRGFDPAPLPMESTTYKDCLFVLGS